MSNINPPRIINAVTDFVPDTALISRVTKQAEEEVDEVHKYISNSMMVHKKPIAAQKKENTVEEMVGRIIDYFG